jgi:hypothetical protein
MGHGKAHLVPFRTLAAFAGILSRSPVAIGGGGAKPLNKLNHPRKIRHAK